MKSVYLIMTSYRKINMGLLAERFWYYAGAVLCVIEKVSKICEKVFTNENICVMITSSNK